MITSINISSVFVLDQDEALDFYVGKLGLEVAADFDLGFMRWLTVCVPGDDSREILLEKPGPPGQDPATGEQVREILSKGGTGFAVGFQVDDAKAEYERLQALDVDITDALTERFYGTDFGIRDPFGNNIRIVQPVTEPMEFPGPGAFEAPDPPR
jgi:catechol 2,3-dioxygenase-like lactoylglutathione lyase family enzyme